LKVIKRLLCIYFALLACAREVVDAAADDDEENNQPNVLSFTLVDVIRELTSPRAC